MCYVSVKCFNCGAEYYLYFDNKPPRLCPHCCAEMPDKAYKKIENALFTVEEVNKDLRKSHDENNRPLFQIEIKNHYVPNEKFNQ